MNTTFVPDFLLYVDRDVEGWPAWMSKQDKVEVCHAVKSFMEKQDKGVPLYIIYEKVRQMNLNVFKDVSVKDSMYAAIHRALLETGHEEVWVHRSTN